MQHAFAPDLVTNAVSTQTTSLYLPQSPNCRTSIIDGFRIDKGTGEIYGQFVVSSLQTTIEQYRSGIPRPPACPSQYLHLMGVRNSDNVVYVDFRGPTPVASATTVYTPSTTPKRGPKPKVSLNPYAAIITVAIAEKAHWIEDAIMAGMYIAVESSNGKLNIRPGYVRKVLTMVVISTEAIAGNPVFRNHDLEPVSERYVRYLGAAGRVALRNIERYLDTHPAEQQRLEMKVLEPKAWGEEFDLDEADYVECPYGAAA
jgi:hypothetical protein